MRYDQEKLDELFGEKARGRAESSNKEKRSAGSAAAAVYDWLGTLFRVLTVFLLLMTFVFRIAKVDGHSMETTLTDTDMLLVTDLFYTPEDGDIVIISHGEQLDRPLVKRVIAVAGQEIRFDFENNAVYVDGEKLDEPYIQGATVRGDIPDEELNGVVPEGKVFVMGDNREHSSDSRFTAVGLIDTSDIIGKVQLDIIPHKYVNGLPVVDFSAVRYVYDK